MRVALEAEVQGFEVLAARVGVSGDPPRLNGWFEDYSGAGWVERQKERKMTVEAEATYLYLRYHGQAHRIRMWDGFADTDIQSLIHEGWLHTPSGSFLFVATENPHVVTHVIPA